MYKQWFSSSVLALLCTGNLAQADTPTGMIDQTFFNSGGPNTALVAPTASNTVAPLVVVSPAPATNEPAPMPDAALFTQVQNLSEQTSDNAVDIFNLKKRKAAEAAQTAAAGTVAPNTTVATAGTPIPQQGMPDPSLFTNTGTPKEQTRDHPFKLF